MRRLFWKEWRERGLWFGLWILAVVVLALIRQGQDSCGDLSYFPAMPPCTMWPAGLALLAGLFGYGSELKGGRVTFLYSRAQLWKSLLFVKIASGVLVTVLAVVLGALASRLTAPIAYLPQMTPAHLAQGAASMALITGCAYLLGLGCSIVLPGLAGGIVTLLLCFGLTLALQAILLKTLEHNWDTGVSYIPIGTGIGAPLLALVILARFGLTLSWQSRLLRFLLTAGVAMVCGLAISLLPPARHLLARLAPSPNVINTFCISPDGRAAFILDTVRGMQQPQWWQLDTGRHVELPTSGYINCTSARWITVDDVLYTNFDVTGKNIFYLAHQDHGQVHDTPLALDSEYMDVAHAYPSPDGTRVLLPDIDKLALVNLQTAAVWQYAIDRKEEQQFRHYHLDTVCWWQDNHTIGYDDPKTGKRMLVKVE